MDDLLKQLPVSFLYGLGSIGVIMALTRIVKETMGWKASLPILSVVIGAGWMLVGMPLHHASATESIVYGSVAGMTATGYYDAHKTLRTAAKARRASTVTKDSEEANPADDPDSA